MIRVLRPSYYRAVFRHGDAPWFNPLEVGVGLGLSQGLVGGAVIGLVIVGLADPIRGKGH